MSLYRTQDDECYLTTQKHCPCIEFGATDGRRHGFHSSQLLSYRLETVGTREGDPPERLTLAFTTADVLITGWHLDRIADRIRDGDLLSVRPNAPNAREKNSLPNSYANVESPKSLVASVTVTPFTQK